MSNHITNREHEPEPKKRTKKMNATTATHLRANETSQHVKKRHERHIFMPVDQAIKKSFPHITIC